MIDMIFPARCHCGSNSSEHRFGEQRWLCTHCKRQMWMPIETAPRDGTQVMLCDHDGDIYTGNYEAPYWWIDQWMPPMMDRDPPYWMPLPEGPGND